MTAPTREAPRTTLQTRDLETLARSSALNLAGSVVAAVLNLILPVVITRSFSREDAGSFFAATALFTILSTAGTVGADTGLLRALPRARALGAQGEIKSLLRSAYVPPLLTGVILSVALVGLGPRIAHLSVGKASGQPEVFAHFLYVLAPFLPLAIVYAVGLSASRGYGAMKPLVLVEKVGRGIAQTGAVALVGILSPTVGLLIVAWTLPYVGAALVLAVQLHRFYRQAMARRPDDAGPTRPDRVISREFWAFSAPRAVSRLFNVALQRFDIILVGALRGPADAAVYTAASRFLVLGLMFVLAIQQVMAPKISELLAKKDVVRSQGLYRTTTSWLTIVSWPMYLVSAIFAPTLLKVFGHGYERGSATVVILCLAMLVATTCGPVDTILLMGGRSSLSLINTGLSLAVDVVVDLILVPHIGITGAAIGWMAAIMVNNLLPLAQIQYTLHMHPFGPATLQVMVFAGACFGAVPLLARLALGPTLPALLLSLVVACPTYLGLLVLRRRALDLDTLGGILRRKGGGGGGGGGRPPQQQEQAPARPARPVPTGLVPGRARPLYDAQGAPVRGTAPGGPR